jgi:hypothetical protein
MHNILKIAQAGVSLAANCSKKTAQANLLSGIVGYQTFCSFELLHKFLHLVLLHDQVPVKNK